MEGILLGLILLICLYILYSIFTKEVSPFINLSTDVENRLGKIATSIRSPNQWDESAAGDNPTGLVAKVGRPIDSSAADTIQNIYHTAMGSANSGPRIDDTQSLLYMINFCSTMSSNQNPFSDPTFANNCGICMTTGSLLTGTTFTTPTGVVVYSGDKEYSLSERIDATPSAHSATCAPIVRAPNSSSNIRSLAINATQYTATKSYLLSNSYTIERGIGSGTHTLKCTGSSNTHPYVIKAGFSRDGEWDTHIGNSIDYSRKNQLATTDLPSTCIEQTECSIPSSSMQWDISSLCGYPKPTAITNLRADPTKITSSNITFIWDGGLYADVYDMHLTADGHVPATPTQVENSSTYSELIPNTAYTFSIVIRNVAGSTDGGSVTASTLDDRIPITNITISLLTPTGCKISWDTTNAISITTRLTNTTTNQAKTDVVKGNSITYTGLSRRGKYMFQATGSYKTAGVLTSAQIPVALLDYSIQCSPKESNGNVSYIDKFNYQADYAAHTTIVEVPSTYGMMKKAITDQNWTPRVPLNGTVEFCKEKCDENPACVGFNYYSDEWRRVADHKGYIQPYPSCALVDSFSKNAECEEYSSNKLYVKPPGESSTQIFPSPSPLPSPSLSSSPTPSPVIIHFAEIYGDKGTFKTGINLLVNWSVPSTMIDTAQNTKTSVGWSFDPLAKPGDPSYTVVSTVRASPNNHNVIYFLVNAPTGTRFYIFATIIFNDTVYISNPFPFTVSK
jgi:hypothetical protein